MADGGWGYIFGAFQPATGAAFTAPYADRTIMNWVEFLEQVEAWLPAGADQVYAPLDPSGPTRLTNSELSPSRHTRWCE